MKTTYPQIIETSHEPTWARSAVVSDDGVPNPHVIYDRVEIRRYRVTFELIDEPIEVLRDRLRKLWRTSKPDVAHREPMRACAKQLGMDPEELEIATQGIDFPRNLLGGWFSLATSRGGASR